MQHTVGVHTARCDSEVLVHDITVVHLVYRARLRKYNDVLLSYLSNAMYLAADQRAVKYIQILLYLVYFISRIDSSIIPTLARE